MGLGHARTYLKGYLMAIEKTFIMSKPDAVRDRKIGEIVARIERSGLVIERMEMTTLERATVEEHIACGDQVILEIDVQGGFQVRDKFPSAHLVFIEPPSLDVLEARLRGRGTETEEAIATRMETARVELSRKMEYDIRLVNDDLDEAVRALAGYVNEQAEKIRG